MATEACGLITINDRMSISLTGVLSVDSFDEFSVILRVPCGKLTVEGENLKIGELDLEKGLVSAGGKINAVYYTDASSESGVGFWARLFGKRS